MTNSIDTYKIFADFYDLYAGKFTSDLEFYRSFCTKTDNIIEIGCGTGRILNCFLELGYHLTGVDISHAMLDKASQKLRKWIDSNKLQLINHNFIHSSLPVRFDKALITFYTFNYILDRPVDFLKNISASLNTNGLLLMDVFYPNTLSDKSLDNKWLDKEYVVNGRKIRFRDKRCMINNTERRQLVFYSNGEKIEIKSDRKYYRPEELKECLKMAGFSNIQFSTGYDLNGFSTSIDELTLKKNYIVKAEKTEGQYK